MLYDLFNRSRKEGLTAIEADLEEPEKSKTFTAYPSVIKDHHVRDFICDTLRTASTGAVEPFDIDQMMELDMEVHHHTPALPVSRLKHRGGRAAGTGNRGGGARAWSSPWGLWAVRRKRSAIRWRPRWWAHF